ncbi:MAG TPA: XylR family transcriptional regulator [Lacipirellulaceae bacterium]|nr:XylR family transcriptional regulator [Lacipirellulaceae bacterium]
MAHQLEVALIIDPGSPYDRRIVRGVAEYVHRSRRDWSLYVEEDLVDRLPDLREWAGHGILANLDDHRIAAAVTSLGIPVVGIGGGYGFYKENPHIPYVRTDNRAIAQMGARYLMNLGFRRFAFCNEPPTKYNGWAQEREEAFVETLRASGFSCDVFAGRHRPAKNWRQSQLALQQWLARIPTPVGLMACQDTRARHVLQACRAIGLRVPDDVAILGVDNDDLMCELTRPPLSSIEQGALRVGFEAAAMLDQLMHRGQLSQSQISIPPERVVERQSTDVTAVDDPDVAEVLEFIRDNACNPIHVSDVLEMARMSRSTLESRFRESLGRTIHAEIRRVQIEAALRLLITTNLPIKEVVQRVGISSVQYFTAVIRNATGRTPGEIRKSALK